MASGVLINECKAEYSENLFPNTSVLNNSSVINKTGGSVDSYAILDDTYRYEQNYSIKCYNNNSVTPLAFNIGTDLNFTTKNDGVYILSFRLLHLDNVSFDDKIKVNIFANAVLTYTIEASLYNSVLDESTDNNKWLTYANSFNFNSDVELGFTFEHSLDPTKPSEESTIWLSGLKFELNDRYLGNPSDYSLPTSYFINKAFLSITETQWDVTDIGAQVITDGSFINLLTLIDNSTNKNTTNTDSFDELDIVSNSIITTYRNCKTIHTIRLSLNIISGSDQHYQIQLRRSIDDSVVARYRVSRDPDETIQTIEMTTRTLNNLDPYTIDGFYIAFVNNSGASCTIDDALSLLIINNYQKLQKND